MQPTQLIVSFGQSCSRITFGCQTCNTFLYKSDAVFVGAPDVVRLADSKQRQKREPAWQIVFTKVA